MLYAKLSGLSDSELILIYQDTQEPDVLTELCDRYIEWTRESVARKCRKYYWLTEEDIEDIYSDFWVRVIARLSQFDCEHKGTFRGWLNKVIGSVLIDYLRKGSAYARNLPSVSIDEEDNIQIDKFVINAEHLPNDFNLEEIVTRQIEADDLLKLINQCFRKERRQVALYELGLGPPPEYQYDHKAYQKVKSDVKSTLCRMWKR